MDKDILVDAIMGRGFLSMDFADSMESMGLARLSGNQWNSDWQWNRDKLNSLTMEELKLIYDESKG